MNQRQTGGTQRNCH